MKNIFLFFCLCFGFISCDSDTNLSASVVGKWDWTTQYFDYPPFSKTPETTGLQETLVFKADGTYSVTVNNKTTNSGTYIKKVVKNPEGKKVSAILYSNTRVTDSISYYFIDKNSKLIFDWGLMGYVGSGGREYIRK